MPKTLKINATLCDLRRVQPGTLDAYARIAINASIVVTNARAQALLARSAVSINTSDTVTMEEEQVELHIVNGKTTLNGRAGGAARQYLVVNGALEITPEAIPTLERYVGATVNGVLYAPQSAVQRLHSLHVNGKTVVWPDGAVPLKNNTVIDRLFLLRVTANHYWTDGCLVMLDPALAESAAPLAERGVHFTAARAIVAQGLAPLLVPLLDAQTDVVIVPNGTAFVRGDAALDETLLHRYGTKLYVSGDLTVPAAAAPLLPRVDYLCVRGTALVESTLLEAFSETGARCDRVLAVRGRVLQGRDEVHLRRARLAEAADGLTVYSCDAVTLDADIPPELIRQKLRLLDCDEVFCTPAQCDAAELISEGVDEFLTDGSAPDSLPAGLSLASDDPDTVCINAVQYAL